MCGDSKNRRHDWERSTVLREGGQGEHPRAALAAQSVIAPGEGPGFRLDDCP